MPMQLVSSRAYRVYVHSTELSLPTGTYPCPENVRSIGFARESISGSESTSTLLAICTMTNATGARALKKVDCPS